MFGECHAHIIMDGVNYRHAIDMHKNGPDDKIIREHLKAYQERGIVFVRDGGDALGVSLIEFLNAMEVRGFIVIRKQIF